MVVAVADAAVRLNVDTMVGDPRQASGSGLEERVVAAARACLARWGLQKTTIDDIAREAGCSRATIYRAFPGGRRQILMEVVSSERDRFACEFARAVAGADSLEELCTRALAVGARFVLLNPVLTNLLAHEPERVLPYLAFDRLSPLLEEVHRICGWAFEPYLGPDGSAEACEWLARLVLSYALHPSEHVDLTRDEDVVRFVRLHVLPGLELLREADRGEQVRSHGHVTSHGSGDLDEGGADVHQ